MRDYALQHAERSRLLQLLVENEINRLSTWSNPINAPGRAQSASNAIENSVTGVSKEVLRVHHVSLREGKLQEQWPALVRRAWKIFPAAAVHMGERFKIPQVQAELARLIRSHPRAVIDVPEALHFLLGTQLESPAVPALKVSLGVRLLWPDFANVGHDSVARVVGSRAPGHRGNLFPAPLRQQSSRLAVCHAGLGAVPRRLDLLLRAPSGTGASIRWSRCVLANPTMCPSPELTIMLCRVC